MAGARCESGRDNHQCNQTSHDGIRKKLAAGVKAHFTKKPRQSWAKAGLSNREWGTRKIPHAPSLRKAQCPNWDRNAI